jgi:DNA-binding transcriptional ArsR family regulator
MAKIGRPPHQPTDKLRGQVEGMAGVGSPRDEIALVLGISENTLRKHYAHELEVGLAKARARARHSLYQLAVDEKNVTALIFYAKTQLGMTEKNALDLTIHTDPDTLTDAELAAIARRGGRSLVPTEEDTDQPPGVVH